MQECKSILCALALFRLQLSFLGGAFGGGDYCCVNQGNSVETNMIAKTTG